MKEDELGEYKLLPVKSIIDNPAAVRSVNRQTEAYKQLAENIKKNGVLKPILVRELATPPGEEQKYGLIDGLHRYTSALDCGKTVIPCIVRNLSDAETLEIQMIANLHNIATTPVEYTRALQRMLASNPFMSQAQLAAKLDKSSEWLAGRLGLLKLKEDIQKQVDDGKINLTNAIMLAKLPEDEQPDWVERAMTQAPNEFGAFVLDRKKEIEAARREGRKANPVGFQAVAHQRKLSEVKAELDNPQVGKILCTSQNCQTAEEGFALAVKWMLHMDPHSIQLAREKFEKTKKEAAEKRAQNAQERAKKAAEEAAKIAI